MTILFGTGDGDFEIVTPATAADARLPRPVMAWAEDVMPGAPSTVPPPADGRPILRVVDTAGAVVDEKRLPGDTYDAHTVDVAGFRFVVRMRGPHVVTIQLNPEGGLDRGTIQGMPGATEGYASTIDTIERDGVLLFPFAVPWYPKGNFRW